VLAGLRQSEVAMPSNALVTGAASGLGRALAALLVERGDSVIGLDRPGGDRAAAVASTGAVFVPCDVTSQSDWNDVARAVGDRFGSIDLLALNAGVMTRMPSDPIDDDPLDLAGSAGYRRVFAVNVDGPVFGLAALRPLLTTGSSVVITASNAGLGGLAFDPYYSASKHAVIGVVRSLGPTLLQHGIRLNALCPGGIDTAIVPDHLRGAVPAAAFRPPADVARALLAVAAQATSGNAWLLSDDDDVITQYLAPDPRAGR
jgi:NAD(P)-dependent dehydrogenase (short-subunit alcohol dehydrogenase family)